MNVTRSVSSPSPSRRRKRRGLPVLRAILAALLMLTFARPACAEPADSERIRRLEESFRCVVCRNQTIADSNADLAADLRTAIHEQVARGATDAEITDFMVRRYGDFVLYRPPFKPDTWLLWLGPFLLCAIGAGVVIRLVSNNRRHAGPETDPPTSRDTH
jgi:cytochrome c-type biogenesis protein CcmH